MTSENFRSKLAGLSSRMTRQLAEFKDQLRSIKDISVDIGEFVSMMEESVDLPNTPTSTEFQRSIESNLDTSVEVLGETEYKTPRPLELVELKHPAVGPGGPVGGPGGPVVGPGGPVGGPGGPVGEPPQHEPASTSRHVSSAFKTTQAVSAVLKPTIPQSVALEPTRPLSVALEPVFESLSSTPSVEDVMDKRKVDSPGQVSVGEEITAGSTNLKRRQKSRCSSEANFDPASALYKCDLCQFSHKSGRYLTYHKTVKHSGSQVVRDPQRKNDPMEKIACDICSAVLMRKAMKQHKRMKHEEARFKCDLCDYKATLLHYLNIHKENKHEMRNFPCDECDYVGSSSMALNRHRRWKHLPFSPSSLVFKSPVF